MSAARRLARHRTAFAALAVAVTLGAALAAVLAVPEPAGPATRLAAGEVDTDGDAIPDLVERARWGTSPEALDSDADGLPDAWEVAHARESGSGGLCPDPATADAARACVAKNLTLADDHRLGTLPHALDSDADGIPDDYEAEHGMDPAAADAADDPFGDGLTNAERYPLGARADRADTACSGMTDAEKAARGLAPSRASTGGSGVPDGYALFFGLDPTDPGIAHLHLDGDPRGLSVAEKARASFAALDLCARATGTPPFSLALDPRRVDSDRDGLPDAWEVAAKLNPLASTDAGLVRPAVAAHLGLAADDARVADRALRAGEGIAAIDLSHLELFLLGACAAPPDCDADGLDSRAEAVLGWNVTVDGARRLVQSDPARRVSDGDRIPDGAKRSGEWNVDGRTIRFPPLDPTTADTDADALADADEILEFLGVLDATRRDTDGDGVADGAEVAYWDARAAADPTRAAALCARCAVLGGDAAPNVANPDADGDGVRDGDETAPRPRPVAPSAVETAPFPPTDPAAADTDGDGLPDAWEGRHARWSADAGWSLDPSGPDESERDPDEDDLANAAELGAGTDPHDADSDDDGLPDGWEVAEAAPGARPPGPPDGVGFAWKLAARAPVPLSPTDGSDSSRLVAAYSGPAGTRSWTLLDVFEAGLSARAPDVDGDALPDLWETLFEAPRAPRPGDAGDGARDPDEDGLPTADEFRLGTHPLERDTDAGGVADGDEVRLGLDPRSGADDVGTGDLDGDGLTNADEIARGTRLDDPDTDRDALLDGTAVVLPRENGTVEDARRRATFLARGILRTATGTAEGAPGWRFAGEHDVTLNPGAGCALKWSCAGDGLPDAWKLRYAMDALAFRSPAEVTPEDNRTLGEQYAWDRPANWSEADHGPWWLGLDPTVADAHPTDLDRDGLHDGTGEDPTPRGGIDAFDRGAAMDALVARAALPAPPAATTARLDVTGSAPATVAKGASFTVSGRLRPAVANVPVLVALVPPESAPASALDARPRGADDAYAVAFTDATGAYRATVKLARNQTVALPAGTVTLFGARPTGSTSWTADTSSLAIGGAYRVLAWSYGVPRASGGVLAGAATYVNGTLRIAGPASPLAPESSAAVGTRGRVDAVLVDGAGDAYAPARRGTVTAVAFGRTFTASAEAGANVTFLVDLPADLPAAPVAVKLRFAGDGVASAAETNATIAPRVGTALAVTTFDARAETGGTLRLAGTLSETRGAPIPDAVVEIALGGARANATTDADGAFEIATRVPATTTPGARAVGIRFAGDRFHEPATKSIGVLVVARPTFQNVTASLELGRGGDVVGRLLAAGVPAIDPVTGEPPAVTLTVGDAEMRATPDAAGKFRFRVPAAATARAGTVHGGLASAASPLVEGARGTVVGVVRSGTELRVADATLVRGEATPIAGRLTDSAGHGVSGVVVEVRVGDLAPVKATTAASGDFRAAVTLAAGAEPGVRPVRATFAGVAPALRASEATAAADVVAGVALRLESRTARTDAPRVAGRVTLDDGSPIAGATLLARTADVERSIATRADGSFAWDLGSVTPGSLRVELTLDAEPGRAALDTVRILTVLRATRVTLRDAPALAPGGPAGEIGVRVVDDLGRGVPGGVVRIALAGAEIGRATTGADGVALVPVAVAADAPTGRLGVDLRFEGTDGHAPSSGAGSLVVRRASVLALDAPERAAGSFTLAAALVDDAGAPVANATVLVAAPGYASPIRVVTGADGRVVVTGLAARQDGDIRVAVLASDRVAPAEASTALSVVSAPALGGGAPWLPWAAGSAAVTILLAVAAHLVHRRARRAFAREVVEALDEGRRAALDLGPHAEAILLAYSHLVRVLAAHDLLDPRVATPREARDALSRAFPLPRDDLDVIVHAFEEARYSPRVASPEDAVRVAGAFARVERALGEVKA